MEDHEIEREQAVQEIEQMYSVKAAAKKLGGVSPWSVYAWTSQGRLRKVKIGSRTMIAESELKRFIEAGKRE
jgi:excisionase family DNA binding protein